MQPILVPGARMPARAASLLPFLSVALAFVFLSLRLLRFIGDYTVNLFYWDQWSFYGGLFQERPLPDLFLWQHGIHRMGLGYVLLWLMAPLSHWDARYDAFLSGGTIVLATLVALFLKFKLTNRLSWTDSIIPLIFLTLYQYDTFIGTANVSANALPLLLVTRFCVALLIRPAVRRYAAMLVINFLSVFTGYGMFLGLITPVVILIDIVKDSAYRRLKYAGLLLSILTVVYFFVGYRLERTIDCFVFPGSPAVDYVGFVMLLYNSFFGLRGYEWFMPLFPAILLVGYISNIVPIYSGKCVSRYMPAAVLFSFSFLFSVNAAVGRVCAGIEAAYASRYVTFVIPAVFALYLTLLHARRWHSGAILPTLLLGAIGYSQIADAHLADTSKSHAHFMQEWKTCYLKSHDSGRCTQRIGRIYWVQDDLQQKLDYLESHRLNLFKDAPGSA
jgi:hypothetical protein